MGDREKWEQGEGGEREGGREGRKERGRERYASTRQNLIVKCFSEACSRSLSHTGLDWSSALN